MGSINSSKPLHLLSTSNQQCYLLTLKTITIFNLWKIIGMNFHGSELSGTCCQGRSCQWKIWRLRRAWFSAGFCSDETWGSVSLEILKIDWVGAELWGENQTLVKSHSCCVLYWRVHQAVSIFFTPFLPYIALISVFCPTEGTDRILPCILSFYFPWD